MYTHVHVDAVTGAAEKGMCLRNLSSILEILLKVRFSVLSGSLGVNREDQQRMGTWASLEFVGK